jgi:4-amino-4-deoxy-L-arabinose transferase-like glycosyltransferase
MSMAADDRSQDNQSEAGPIAGPRIGLGQKDRRRTFYLLAAILVVAFVVRFVVLLNRQAIDYDETAYARMAYNFFHGLGLFEISGQSATHFTPLFPIVLGAVSLVVNNYELAGQLVSLVAGVGLVLGSFYLARTLYDSRVGLVTAALVAVMPNLVDYSSKLYAESLYTFLLVFGVLVGWLALTRRTPWLGLVAGLLLGLGYLARPEGFFYLPAFVLVFLLVAVFGRHKASAAWAGGAFFVGFMVMAIPYMVFLHSQLGYWTYSGKGAGPGWAAKLSLRYEDLEFERIAYGLTPDKHSINILANQDRQDIVISMLSDPVTQLRIAYNQAVILYSQQLYKIFPLWLLPLVGLGLFARFWNKARLRQELFIVWMLVPAGIVIASYVFERFFVPYMPFLLMWTALGVVQIEQWIRESLAPRLAHEPRPVLATATSEASSGEPAGPPLPLGSSAGGHFDPPTRLVAREPTWLAGLLWVPLIVVCLSMLPFALKPAFSLTAAQQQSVMYRDTGQWIQANLGGNLRVMARRASLAYYADGTWLMLPYANLDDILAYSRYQGVDAIVIDVRADLGWRPDLQPLVDGSSIPPGFRKVGDLSYGGGNRVLVYAVEKS